MNDAPPQPPETAAEEEARPGSWKRTLAVSSLILLAAAGAATVTFFTEPTATRGGASKQTAMLVEVKRVESGTHRPLFIATGTVAAEQDIVLRPQVSGEIVKRAPRFTPGEVVDEGQLLVKIQSADYRNTLAQRRSELQQALSDLAIEKGRQSVARKEYEFLKKSTAGAEESLVLRKPQLEAAQIRVEAARARVDQAELDLRRTTIKAPFDALILRRDVDLGSQVSPGDSLGRLLGLETYWVEATVPLAKLRWIAVSDAPGEEGAEVHVRNRAAWPEGASRRGHLHRVIGALDEKTRLARLLVAIPDPLARGPDAGPDTPKLMVGEFLEVRIRGGEIADVVRLERDYVRDDDTVWVMEGDELRIRDVEIVLRDAKHAYSSSGLQDGDRVVTTNLSTVTDGAKLRLAGEETPAE